MEATHDWSLVAQAQQGNMEAFGALVRRYERPVVNFCWRMVGSAEDAEELAQETFLRVYRHLGRLRESAKFSTFLFGIARNLSLNHIRNQKRKGRNMQQSLTALDGRDIPAEDARQRPDKSAHVKEIQEVLERALALLSPEHREVVLLRELEGLDYDSIAGILKCRKGTVKSRLARAREQLRIHMMQLGGGLL